MYFSVREKEPVDFRENIKMSHKIVKKTQLSENVFSMEVEAFYIARARRPGQFIILSLSDDYGERIPLTIADADAEKGTIRLIFQRVGKTTTELADLGEGDTIANVAGPLGNPTDIEEFGRVVCVAGGIGAAPLFPITKALKAEGNRITSIIGARTADMLILEDEFEQLSEELIITTDDGSKGRKALVTEPLEQICKRPEKPDQAFVIGPAIMMRFCSEVTARYEVPTKVSLNTIMIDGTGMCGGCRIEYDGKPKFVCVDGPEFDADKVNWDLMIKRLNAYKPQEKQAHESYKEHRCRIGLDKKQ